jgi:hypothetical protein
MQYKDYNFSKLDKTIDKIIKQVSFYIKNLSESYIKKEIYRAYKYALDAHK